MKATRLLAASLVLAVLTISPGCMWAPRSQLAGVNAQNRILKEQCRAQLAEIENLKIHSRNTEDQLMRTEEDLALLEEQFGLDRKQLANYRRERAEVHEQFRGLAAGRLPLPREVSQQLVELSKQYPNLHFDPVAGISKLDTDVLFDSGHVELKPAAKEMLAELVGVLNSPQASDLKIVVAGHTDNRRIAKRPARDQFPNNFHLSTARANAVADLLCQAGLDEKRIGVAGFGAHQPIAPNVTPADRKKNRRVEIFVMNSDVPVVGWTDSMPSVY